MSSSLASSTSPDLPGVSNTEAAGIGGDNGNDADLGNGVLPLKMSTAAKTTSSLDHDSIEGFMTVHRKKNKRQRFLLPKSNHYVVANAMKHALEIYNNESRSELVYLLSLADAVLSFESDNSNIVMEKCFCVEVRTWKKKNTVHLQPQCFIFFEEDQTRMLLWVKCIHLAIKRATTLDSELFWNSTPASPLDPSRRFSDSDDIRVAMEAAAACSVADDGDRRCASNASVLERVRVSSSTSSPTSSSAFAVAREKLTQRLVIDPASRIATVGRTMLTPSRSSSATSERSERQPSTNRWSTMFSHDKQQQTRSPMSSGAADGAVAPVDVIPHRLSAWRRSAKATTDASSETFSSQNAESVTPTRSLSSKAPSPPMSPIDNDIAMVTPVMKSNVIGKGKKAPEVEKSDHHPSPVLDVNGVLPDESSGKDNMLADLEDPKPIALPTLMTMVGVAVIAGVSGVSIFLPVALAGALAHLFSQHDHFTTWTLSSLAVYLSSTCHVIFGVGVASVFIYMWGYANFKTRRRQRARLDFQASHSNQPSAGFKCVEVPNWLRYPDVDRVEWLNKVFVTGWPYLKIAIKDSVLASINPVLDAQKPAFMNTLSLVRMDLGTKTPHISGVKFVSANTLTDEVTLDVDVRVVTDKSFVAEIKMVSHLGAAVCLTLRELFLVGTLRITLHPLATYWPCFSALSLSFTTRPVFDFSLTAAKINFANVPFVSEWLHTFLYDLLINYFVWPKVVDIPLWDEQGNSYSNANV